MPTIQARVIAIIAENMNVTPEEIKLTDDFINDIGTDSLDLIDIVMQTESAFSISIPDEQTFNTVADLVIYVEDVVGMRG